MHKFIMTLRSLQERGNTRSFIGVLRKKRGTQQRSQILYSDHLVPGQQVDWSMD